MTISLSFIKKYGFFIFLALLFGFQLFFITSDPDTLVDINTRGAWTDEALYPLQSRQLVDVGYMDIETVDTLVRSPIFNALQLPLFLILGTDLWVSRLVVLLLVFASVLIYALKKESKAFAWALTLVFLTQYHIFQFSHYSLVYMVCVSFLLMSMYFFRQATTKENYRKQLFFSALFVFLTYGTTIQFAAVIFILPVASFLYLILSFLKEKKAKWNLFLWSILWTIVFVLIYIVAWYLPNKKFIDFLLNAQLGSRFPTTFLDIKNVISYNFHNILWTDSIKLYVVLGGISILGYIAYFFIKKKHSVSLSTICFLAVWLAIELPKTAMFYLPYRYLIALISVVAVIIALGSSLFSEKKKIRLVLFAVLGVVGIINMSFNYKAFLRRTNDISELNAYLNKTVKDKSVILGAWAAAFTWESKVKCIPIWKGYMNDSCVVEQYLPEVIISETNEEDNDYYYQSSNYFLFEEADSIRLFNVWRYEIGVFWVNEYQKKIDKTKEYILSDKAWLELVKTKAIENNISLDSSLFLEAKYAVDQERK